jgi:uncharacterized protein YbjT (DUF2867 family)
MRLLLIGCTGLVGRELVPHLVAAGVRQVPVEQVRQTYLAMAETGLLIH